MKVNFSLVLLLIIVMLSGAATCRAAEPKKQEYATSCKVYGYGKQICTKMIDAYMEDRQYSGPEAFVMPDDSAKGQKFYDCIKQLTQTNSNLAPWLQKNDYEIAVKVCNKSVAEAEIGAPSFDTYAYCKQIGDVAGGSNEIELTCRQQEDEARSWIDAHGASSRTMKYCTSVAEAVGDNSGSYEILKTCIEQEESAATQL